MPAQVQWAVVENLTLAIGRHTFLACRAERGFRKLSFAGSQYLNYIPLQAPGVRVIERGSLDPPQPARCRRGRFEFSLLQDEAKLLSMCDGKRTIGQIHGEIMSEAHERLTDEWAQSFFENMWKLGHVWILN